MEVTILLGSKSDMPVAEKCTKILEMFEVTYQLRVASAHRSPAFVESIIKDAEADTSEFLTGYYGEGAAPHIRRYMEEMQSVELKSSGLKMGEVQTSECHT